jgi:phosphoglucosamine mutase
MSPASSLTGLYPVLPQRMVNIPYHNKQVLEHPDVQAIIDKSQKQLGRKGRLVIRKSGTEPVIRIMVEAEDGQFADKLLKNIQQTICRYADETYIS